MAITPQEAAQLTDGELINIETAEQQIDQGAREGAKWGTDRIIVGVGVPVTRRVRQELTRRYTEAGWAVTWHDSQLDGVSIELRPPQSGTEMEQGGG